MTQKLSRHCMILAAALSLGGTFASSVSAQPVSTRPVGAMTYSIPATTSASLNTVITVPLQSAATYSGAIASVTSNSITLSGTPFTAGALAVAGSPFFVKITSGLQLGRTILVTANTASSITVDTTDNSTQTVALDFAGLAVVAGDKVEVIPGDTIASLLGDNTGGNPLLLVSGANGLTADTIGIFNKSTGKSETFFYSTVSSFWRSTSVNANRNNQVLYPESGIVITRQASRPALSFTVLGDVPSTKSLIKLTGASTVLSGTSYPVDMTLGQIVFSGWVTGTNALSADNIGIFNSASGKYDTYFKRTDNGFWNRQGGGATDRSSVVIPAGSAFRITKISAVTGANSYVSLAMPYSL